MIWQTNNTFDAPPGELLPLRCLIPEKEAGEGTRNKIEGKSVGPLTVTRAKLKNVCQFYRRWGATNHVDARKI